MSSDVERLRRDVSLPDTASSFGVKLEKDGDEFVGCCPFHAEKTSSFTIFVGKDHVQRFHCFGCGERGDVLDFVQKIKGVGLREAISILGGASVGPNVTPRQVKARDIYEGIEPIEPPANLIEVGKRVRIYNPKRKDDPSEWGGFAPSMVFPYRRVDGSLFGYVLRHELGEGGKETPMIMAVRLPDGRECWSRYPFPKPRPLYGLDRIGDARQVIVVEGEKCADALASETGRVVLSWAGGTQGVKHTDWSPLSGRNVVIWPDADAPGLSTADEIATILVGLGCTVRVMDVMRDDPPKGWDCADAIHDGWDKARVDQFMRETVRPWARPEAAQQPAEKPTPVAGPAPAAPAKPIVEARTVQQEQEQPATVTDIRTRRTVAADDNWMLGLVCNEEGKIKPGATKNWALFLENHPDMAGVFAFDAFKLRVMLMRRPPWEAGKAWDVRSIQDRDYSEAVMWLEARQMSPKASNIAAVIQTIAERSSFDRLREYLEGLKWDRRPRVEKWVTYYMGVEDTPYARTVGLRWLVSAVARGLRAGCKVDTMPILEGPQGARKSTALRFLYGDEFFTDELSDVGSKDAKMEMQGVWGIEVAEMHKFSAAEVNAVKKFLTQQTDRFRPPYGRTVIEAPRRVVLNGTINPEGNAYLRDPTGARRFWPLTVGSIDTDAIAIDRDQLWAEAVELYRANTPWWVQEEEQQAVEFEQEKRTDVDVWVDKIAPLIKGQTSIAQIDILGHLGIPMKDADWRHAGRVGRIMKKLGWAVGRDRRGNEDRVMFYAPQRSEAAGGDEQKTLDW
ncbi:VapE domain-containing protein [Bradyrhizobium sp. HKCCYLS2038]|uniref:VapE domain-containing protein n=1 Tax=Bradyrhizobium sp. HKCCYLS2038 TaxID=3420764 RepID=UPI003EB78BDE